ncbi:MAG: hypothetical protein LBT70_00475 [Holosporaceae bacterium]|jgi:hypothetical protein|nr:hypothetical protein [Holosporaceae bacterium]
MKTFIWLSTMGFLSLSAFCADQVAVNKENSAAGQETEAQMLENAENYSLEDCSFNGIYFVLGLGSSFYKNGVSLDKKAESCATSRFLGVMALGGGRVFGEALYLGAEALCDFSKTKEKILNINGADASVKIAQLIPSLGVRLGYYNQHMDTMFYTKVMASRVNADFKYVDHNRTHTKISPAIVLGMESAFSKKFSARLECEYRFSSNNIFSVQHNGSKLQGGAKIARGINVRALVAYRLGAAK